MSGFDNRKNISYRADAPSFSAVIRPGPQCKAQFSHGSRSSKSALHQSPRARWTNSWPRLLRLDAGCKFYKTGAEAGTLSPKDAAMLAQLRDDKNTSDAVYRTACASFGQKPEPRNITVAPVASTANLPQGVPALRALPRLGWRLKPPTVSYFNHHTAS